MTQDKQICFEYVANCHMLQVNEWKANIRLNYICMDDKLLRCCRNRSKVFSQWCYSDMKYSKYRVILNLVITGFGCIFLWLSPLWLLSYCWSNAVKKWVYNLFDFHKKKKIVTSFAFRDNQGQIDIWPISNFSYSIYVSFDDGLVHFKLIYRSIRIHPCHTLAFMFQTSQISVHW